MSSLNTYTEINQAWARNWEGQGRETQLKITDKFVTDFNIFLLYVYSVSSKIWL